jgi:hypothetical protein
LAERARLCGAQADPRNGCHRGAVISGARLSSREVTRRCAGQVYADRYRSIPSASVRNTKLPDASI